MAVSGPEDADDTYQEEDDEDDVKSLHSDALDDDSDQETEKHARKRKRASPVKSHRAKASSPRKRRKNAASDEDEEGEGYDLKEGQQIVGKVVQAPKTGRGTRCVYILEDVRINLLPQFHRVRYLKILSTSFCSSKSQNATTANGEDALSFIHRYV